VNSLYKHSEATKFSLAVSILADPIGVHHTGQLLAQYLILIGSYIGVSPLPFLEHGHLCEDNAEKIIQCLEEKYGIFEKAKAAGQSMAEIGHHFLVALQN
jgi:hypothetical protein